MRNPILHDDMQQHKEVITYFDRFFELEKFDHIVELGTGNGLFTLYLAKHAAVTTFDMVEPNIKLDGVRYIKADLFDLDTIEQVKSYIEQPRRTLLLCDGGCKEAECAIYSRFLGFQDRVLVHDYAECPTWPWPEFFKPPPFIQKDEKWHNHFKKVAWFIGRRIR